MFIYLLLFVFVFFSVLQIHYSYTEGTINVAVRFPARLKYTALMFDTKYLLSNKFIQ